MAPRTLAVGYAKLDLTPPVGGPLAGVIALRGRSSTAVRDPLHARALTLGVGGRVVTLVAADLLVVPTALHDAVARGAGVPAEDVLVSATHTHSGPGGYWDVGPRAGLIMGPYDPAAFEELAAKLAACVRASRDRLVPARVHGATVAVPGANANRRRLHGPIDPDLTLVRFTAARGTGDAPIDLVSFGAHPVVVSEREPTLVSADFPGDLCARLERRGVRPLFFQGPVGGLSPLFPEFPMRLEPHLALVGDVLERGWERATAALAPIAATPFDARILHVPLPPATARILPDDVPGHRVLETALTPLTRWMHTMAERGRRLEPDARLHLVRFGAAALLGTPCDLGVTVALALKEALRATGVRHPMVGSQCDGYVGYVHLPEDYAHVPERGFRSLCYYENAMSLSGWELGARFVRSARSWLADAARGTTPS